MYHSLGSGWSPTYSIYQWLGGNFLFAAEAESYSSFISFLDFNIHGMPLSLSFPLPQGSSVAFFEMAYL